MCDTRRVVNRPNIRVSATRQLFRKCGRKWTWDQDAAVHPSVAVVHAAFCDACCPEIRTAPLLWCVGRDGQRWKLEFNVRETV